ncbi:MAG TPA: hypothetical protein VD811_05750 [Desulfuromonadales bacterium]|nr:hypothetical protein [Desulfuromonadales bacterium]
MAISERRREMKRRRQRREKRLKGRLKLSGTQDNPGAKVAGKEVAQEKGRSEKKAGK